MCGIVAGISNSNIKEFLLDGLSLLQYRGYDSAGIAFIENGNIKISKTLGNVDKLKNIVKTPSNVAIAHTRWATHGAVSITNCHPHTSNHKLFYLVHNGVIENDLKLKERLKNENYTFYSSTDTEVLVNIIEEQYFKTNDVLKSLENTLRLVKGTLGVAIIFKNELDKIYFMKRRSPLLIGVSSSFNLIASDILAMQKSFQKFIELNDDTYGFISKNQVQIYQDNNLMPLNYLHFDESYLNIDKNGYQTYMLKEIEEIPLILEKLINEYFTSTFNFNDEMLKRLKKASIISFIASGSSYHAALIGKYYFESLGKKVNTYIASEWAYFSNYFDNEIFILISQSGETQDVIMCLDKINKNNKPSIIITNHKNSYLCRHATYVCLLHAGFEISVASTKAYHAQVALLYLLKCALICDVKGIDELKKVISSIKKIEERKDAILHLAKQILIYENIFFIGRGLDFYASKEGSLKLKEITYIHSEALEGGELKHGPISLISKDFATIGLITNESIGPIMRLNYQEVNSRNGHVFALSSTTCYQNEDEFMFDSCQYDLTPLLSVHVFQYLAYFVALLKNVNIDRPRNLAKSVTVE